ncbi:hypothetical protein, conserved [Leishmania tarentolae]|uniref:Uncharacterized protein n=1 Tax=Leishmania tarentolae TaxID=5689 RepID=A0A640KSI6_LEITA|nr:hypothetical protein, conserved [Leishmania tarentolae]
MESKVIALLTSRPLLTADEAATELGVAHGDLQPVFASIAASHEGIYTLLCSSVEEAADGSATAISMRRVDCLKEDPSAYALLSMTCPSNVSASSLPVQLHPSSEVSLRAYPLVARDDMEIRAAAAAPPLPLPAEPRSPVAAATPRAIELARPEDTEHTVASSSFVATPIGPTGLPQAQAEPPKSMPTLSTVAPSKEGAAAQRPLSKATIFDKMKEAASTKRPRGEGASSKPPRQPAKPKKVAKTEHTTSLAKLARASKKSGGTSAATGAGTAPPSMRFLDDDEVATTPFGHSECSSSHSEPIAKEESPIFDVVELPASNDEVIMCDDAPPLAFRPAAPRPSPTTPTPTKKVPEVKKASSAVAAAEASAAQCRLSTFFNDAIVKFQKSYVREIQTETKMENGEFVCCDVACYKHSATGEVISEDEYHQRTAALVRRNSQDAAGGTPNGKIDSTPGEAPPCPAAAQKEGSRRAAQKPAAQEKTAETPAKTLHYFFKASSA